VNSRFFFQVGRSLFYFFVFAFCFFQHQAAFASLDFGGYYKNNLIGIIKKGGDSLIADENKIRWRIDLRPTSKILLHLEPEYATLIKSLVVPLFESPELDKLNWDRLYLKLSFPQTDLTLGKQRIAWGTGHVWNPTDVFNPFALSFAVAEEERKGIEAIRLQIPYGPVGGFEGVILTGNEWAKSKKGLKAKVNIGLFDLSASYVDMGDGSNQIGFDSAGEIRGVGFRNETALVSPVLSSSYLKSVLGLGYTLDNGWGIDFEYYFNGLGKRNIANYNWAGLFAGEIVQLGMDYIYLGFNKTIDEITSIRFSLLMNADDQTWIFFPSYERNVMQNVDVGLVAMVLGGQEGGEYNPTFGQDPTGFIASKRILIKLRCSF